MVCTFARRTGERCARRRARERRGGRVWRGVPGRQPGNQNKSRKIRVAKYFFLHDAAAICKGRRSFCFSAYGTFTPNARYKSLLWTPRVAFATFKNGEQLHQKSIKTKVVSCSRVLYYWAFQPFVTIQLLTLRYTLSTNAPSERAIGSVVLATCTSNWIRR